LRGVDETTTIARDSSGLRGEEEVMDAQKLIDLMPTAVRILAWAGLLA
jgi:hypothetical protein